MSENNEGGPGSMQRVAHLQKMQRGKTKKRRLVSRGGIRWHLQDLADQQQPSR